MCYNKSYPKGNKRMEETKVYICKNCGEIFEEPKIVKESRGEFWGHPAFEDCYYSPCCGCDYDEAIECNICGEWYSEDDLCMGVCSKCIDDYRHNFKICHDISFEDEKRDVKINALVATLLDEGDINQILVEFITARMPDVDCSIYIDNDISWFCEILSKKKGVK